MHDYKISTITATCSLGIKPSEEVKIEHCYNLTREGEVLIDYWSDEEGPIFAKYHDNIIGEGFRIKRPNKRRDAKPSSPHRFKNQITYGIRVKYDPEEIPKNELPHVNIEPNRRTTCPFPKSNARGFVHNVKVFENGILQITGLRYPSECKKVADILSNILELKNPPHMYHIHMINAYLTLPCIPNFENFKLVLPDMGFFYSYSPADYHGFKVIFKYNHYRDGICHCADPTKCSGKRRAKINPRSQALAAQRCKNVTLLFFNSRKMLITGANNLDQIDACYEFVARLMEETTV